MAEELIKAEADEPSARVTRITIGRVFNLGNYENQKVELSVEVGAKNAGAVYSLLESAMQALKPIGDDYDAIRASKVLAKPASELASYEVTNLEAYRRLVSDHDAKLKARAEAIQRLSNLDAALQKSERVAHTTKWNDDEDDD